MFKTHRYNSSFPGFVGKNLTPGDYVESWTDNCSNEESIPWDSDGDGCIDDSDGDGVKDNADLCSGFDDNVDIDGDTIPDDCDSLIDSDADGVADSSDTCSGYDDAVDVDADGIPDGCDSLIDSDGDGEPQEGEKCVDGDTKTAEDGCNQCVCNDEEWICTEVACVDDDSDGTIPAVSLITSMAAVAVMALRRRPE